MRPLILFLFILFFTPLYSYAHDVSIPLHRSEVFTKILDSHSVKSEDTNIASAVMHKQGRFSIIGNSIGSTKVSVLDKSGKTIKTISVVISEDLPGVRRAVRELFPSEQFIRIDHMNGKIALSGSVSTRDVSDKVHEVVSGYAKNGVVNLMKISDSQQVTLVVRVGEVQRSELKKLGISFDIESPSGNHLNTGMSVSEIPFGIGALTSTLFSNSLSAKLEALEMRGAYKILASPTLTAISGQTASFSAGGEFPVIIPGSSGSLGVDYKPFGVSVKFTPTVLSGGLIRLDVAPEVSDVQNTVSGSTASLGKINIPSFNVRKASTTVELMPGESFMIAGLVKNDTSVSVADLPGIAKIPLLGALFRSSSFVSDDTELVISVTPHIVHPVQSREIKIPSCEFDFMHSVLMGSVDSSAGKLALEGVWGYMVD